jgi:hypothetical protein
VEQKNEEAAEFRRSFIGKHSNFEAADLQIPITRHKATSTTCVIPCPEHESEREIGIKTIGKNWQRYPIAILSVRKHPKERAELWNA